MKKLFIFSTVVGLVMAAGVSSLVLAQTTYELRATNSVYPERNFQLRYIDLDHDQKFSLNELLSFSGVYWPPDNTYTEISGVPSDTTDSPFTDGPESPNCAYVGEWWHFAKPSDLGTCIRPNEWTYSQAPAGSKVVVSVPGKTILSDAQGDFLLRNCNVGYPDIPCSLPPAASQTLPGYLDIRQAGITQIGRGMVDLTISLYEPIPAVPDYPFVSYFWQFEGGCVVNLGGGDKAGIHVTYAYVPGEGYQWTATWLEIISCSPRVFEKGDPVPFVFTENGVKVRVPLNDLLTAVNASGEFLWHTGVRLVSFGHPAFINSMAVDHLPDVLDFKNYTPEPPHFVWFPEAPAMWEHR